MIFDYDGVKRALNDHEVFSSSMFTAKRANPPWFIFFDAPQHTKLRALVMRAFTPRMVANLEPRVRELSHELLDQRIEQGEMDLASDFSIPLPMMVIAEMLGVPAADRPHFRRWSDVMLNLSFAVPGGQEATQASQEYFAVKAEMGTYLAGLLANRRAAPRDDLLTRLVEAEVDGQRLTDEEILGFFQLLLIAGSETTTNLLNNAILCLIENPDQLARLRTTPDLLESAIEEVLRYRSPVQWMFRATKREIEVGGQKIPAGKLVLPMIGSANRVRARRPLLPGRAALAPGGQDRSARLAFAVEGFKAGERRTLGAAHGSECAWPVATTHPFRAGQATSRSSLTTCASMIEKDSSHATHTRSDFLPLRASGHASSRRATRLRCAS
jgi:cytochrome P450